MIRSLADVSRIAGEKGPKRLAVLASDVTELAMGVVVAAGWKRR